MRNILCICNLYRPICRRGLKSVLPQMNVILWGRPYNLWDPCQYCRWNLFRRQPLHYVRVKKSDLDLSTSRRRFVDYSATASRHMNAFHEMCLCESHLCKLGLLWSSTWQRRKETMYRISSSQQAVTLSAITRYRLPARRGHSATFDIHIYSPTTAMLPLLSKPLFFPSWQPLLFYLYFLSSFLCSTNLPFSPSPLLNLFHFVFSIFPFTLFLSF